MSQDIINEYRHCREQTEHYAKNFGEALNDVIKSPTPENVSWYLDSVINFEDSKRKYLDAQSKYKEIIG